MIWLYSLYSKDMTLKCSEEGRSLSSETFSKISITNLRRQAIPDLSTDMSMNIFKKVCWVHFNRLRKQVINNTLCLGILYFLLNFSLRTAERTGKERALFHFTIREKKDSDVWGCPFSCTKTTWMCHLHEVPSRLEASLDWAMIGGPWSEVAGPQVSWVTQAGHLSDIR